MIIPLQFVAESGDPDGAKAALGKGGAVRCAAHQGNASLCAGDSRFFRRAQKLPAKLPIRRDGAVQVPQVDQELLRIVNGIDREDRLLPIR